MLACLLPSKVWSLRYLPGQGNSLGWVVVLYVGEESEMELCHLLGFWQLSITFLTIHKQNWALLVLIPGWVGLCTFWDPVGVSSELSCEAGSFSRHPKLHRFLPPEVLRLYFPTLEPWVAQCVSLPSCSSLFICIQMWGCRARQLQTLPPRSSSHCLAVCPLGPCSLSLSFLLV